MRADAFESPAYNVVGGGGEAFIKSLVRALGVCTIISRNFGEKLLGRKLYEMCISNQINAVVVLV